MAELPPLPAGFTLDNQAASSVPPLPPGFTLDSQQPASARGAYDARYGGQDPSDRPPMLPEEMTPQERQPSPQPSAFSDIRRYLGQVDDAVGRLNRAPNTGGLGSLEALTTLGTGGIAAPILGTAESIAIGTPPEEAFARYTYQPRTESGKAQLGVIGALASPITESGLDVALGPLIAGESRILSAGPAKIRPNARRPGFSRDPVPPQPGAVDGAIPARPPGSQPAQAGQRPTGLEGVSPADTEVAPDLVLEQTTRTIPKTPEARAQEYVKSIGVDWSALPREMQATMTNIAKDARNLEGLDKASVARQLQLQAMPKPIPATRGQITRDPVQLRNEGNVSATNTGAPIRDIYLDQNQAILDNLDILKGKVANRTKPAETPEQVGLSVQDQALREKLKLSKENVSAKYKAAEAAGELEGKVSPARLIKTIRGTPDRTHFQWVESWLKNMEVENGGAVNKLSLKELEDLRQAAVARAMDGGTEGFYAGKIISAIDQTTESAGGKLYKEARAARRAQAMEFEETGAIARLVENKSRTDRATALEDTWRKTVIGGSVQDLRNVKRSLLTGGDSRTRNAGKRAWSVIKSQTIQHIQNEATKGVALNERGQPNVTPAAMKRAIDSIGKEKLDEIFGPNTSLRVYNLLEATRTVKTVPPAGHAGSSTMSNILSFLERGLNKVPFVGDVAAGTIKAGAQLKQMGEAGRLTREAQRLPLQDAAQAAKKRNALSDF
jgi:hypothetical protein